MNDLKQTEAAENDSPPNAKAGALSRSEFLAESGFLDIKGLCERVPLSPRTLREALKRKHIPHIRLPHAHRLLFDWVTVRTALRRFEKGGID